MNAVKDPPPEAKAEEPRDLIDTSKMSSGQLVDVIYDVRLVDIQSKRIVWRAAVTFYRGGTIIPSTDRGAALAVDITNKMKEDHIFRTCEVIKAKS